MVHIINGEIVPDDDPRVKARQTPSQPANAYQRRPVAGFGASSPPPQAPQAPPMRPAPFQNLARQLGLEGTVTIPGVPVLGFPPKPVEKIYLAISALLVLLFGWRALVFLGFAYFMSLQPPTPPQPPQPPQPPAAAPRR